MCDKNHYNIVISLQLIKINEKQNKTVKSNLSMQNSEKGGLQLKISMKAINHSIPKQVTYSKGKASNPLFGTTKQGHRLIELGRGWTLVLYQGMSGKVRFKTVYAVM